METRLAVILGAGGSHDLIANSVMEVNADFRPPLAADLFNFSSGARTILGKYPRARALASNVVIRINRGEALEAVLRSLRDSSDPHIVRQFRQIPLFLQELFGEISEHYTAEPVNYSYLVNQALSASCDRIAFVTMNYDLLLDKAVEVIAAQRIQAMGLSFYCQSDAKWMLIKLHGSANWARPIAGLAAGQSLSDEEYLDIVDSASLEGLGNC